MEKHSKLTDIAIISLLKELIDENVTLSLVDGTKSLKAEIQRIFTENIPKRINEEKLTEYKKLHKALLSCEKEDEHVLFLSYIRILADEHPEIAYKEILGDFLTKNIHSVRLFSHDIQFVGRKKEQDEIKRILSKSERNSVLIIGTGGIGKTALASRVCEDLSLKKQVFRLFPSESLLHEQISTILSSVKKTDCLFFLDELFSFSAKDISFVLQNTTCIATANDKSYRKFLQESPQLASKFEVIKLDMLDDDALHVLLQGLLSQKKDFVFEKGFIQELLTLGKRYLPDQSFPSKGIGLIEESIALAKEKKSEFISINDLKTIVSQKTNVPLDSLTDLDKEFLAQLPEKISQYVKGQDEAVKRVSAVIQRSKLGFGAQNKPIGSFLFVGPSGVGKTELAKTVARILFGDSEAMIRLDMSEYAEAHTVQRLIGAPPGYIGFEEGGQLTNPISDKPYSLVLLDEIEKAHPRVFDIFLQVLDDGRLTDGQGKSVDFTNTVIIATSNAGIEDILDLIEEGKSHEEISTELKTILQDYFRIEFLNRFNDIVIFNSLNKEALEEIAHFQIEKLKEELLKRKISLHVSDTTFQKIASESVDPRYGARGLLRLIQEKIENPIAQLILENKVTEGMTIKF